MSFEDNLYKIKEKYELIASKLSSDDIDRNEYVLLSKEYSDLTPIIEKINLYLEVLQNIDDLNELLNDPEMHDIAYEELIEAKESVIDLKKNVQIALLPRDEADEKNAIIEIRAGTGGEEAALFAFSLFRMYQKYAELSGWKFEILSVSETGIGGYKEASASISGKNVFAKLKFESGVHRVQRVPETESSGRIHTSAATVAVLAEAEEVDIQIDEKDLKIDVFRASGAGGQHVNTTESAVRITHIPTGVVVSQQDEKSQHKNKAKALKILRSRIYEAEREKKDRERSDLRKNMVGSGDRSERIRTYNYPQGRVSDHRINLTLYKIIEIVEHGMLDEIIDALISSHQASLLSQVG